MLNVGAKLAVASLLLSALPMSPKLSLDCALPGRKLVSNPPAALRFDVVPVL